MALDLLDAVTSTAPTLDPIYHEDLSAYAPLAPPILLRVGSRPHFTRLRAAIRLGQGRCAFRQGDRAAAWRLLDESLALSRDLLLARPDRPGPRAARTVPAALPGRHAGNLQ